jgi:uncharacterized protein (DUF488 family)
LESLREHGHRDAGPIFTVGHSTRALDELVGLLRAHRISVLVDIRRIRRSRANPQFNGETLGPALAREGIAYEPLASLGGLRRGRTPEGSPNAAWENASFRSYADYATTAAFREGLDELVRIGARTPTAIMCAEAVWWRCHRRIVADHLLARGIPVIHVFTATHAEPASLTPFAVVASDGAITYPRPDERHTVTPHGHPGR